MTSVQRPTIPPRADALRSLFIEQLRSIPDHETRKVRENFLSACFAGALNASESLARRVVRRLVGGDTWMRMRVGSARIRAGSQIRHRTNGSHHDDCILDLVIDVNDRRRIGVEVKLEAREGVDADGRRQLARYIALSDLDGVAFLTADAESIPDDFWGEFGGRRYLAPKAKTGFIRRHFVWGDFYDDVVRATQGRHVSPVVTALRGLMDHLQLQPVHPIVGELGGRLAFKSASPVVQQNRLRIQEAMRDAVELLPDGWHTTEKGPRDNGTLYTWREDDLLPGFWNIWASTNLTPGAFRIWICAENRKTAERLYRELPTKFADALRNEFGRDVKPHVLPMLDAVNPAVDCRLPLSRLLSGVRKSDSVGPQLGKALRAAAEVTEEVLRRR